MALRCAYFNGFGRGTELLKEAAEKRHLPCVLKGRTFRCAVQVLSSCHSEWASAHEESALRTFSAASEAVPLQSRRPTKAGHQPKQAASQSRRLGRDSEHSRISLTVLIVKFRRGLGRCFLFSRWGFDLLARRREQLRLGFAELLELLHAGQLGDVVEPEAQQEFVRSLVKDGATDDLLPSCGGD